MSIVLERLGRVAARRPWLVIFGWIAAAVLVVTSSATFGRDLEDPFEAPGLDSHEATQLLERASSNEQGIGADVVLTPRDAGASFLDSPALRAEAVALERSGAISPAQAGMTLQAIG